MPAYIRSTLMEFTRADPVAILGSLHNAYTKDGFATQYTKATKAWEVQVKYLQGLAKDLIDQIPASSGWGLLLEYPMPRRS
jgi:hypothetical protein